MAADSLAQAFFSHKQHVRQEPRKVTRASAVFYFTTAIEGRDVDTEIHYMHYWREKVGLMSLTRRLTFRNMEGERLAQHEDLVSEQGAHVIAVSDFTASFSRRATQGSLEVEFLSEGGLGMAYPALVVRYVSNDWHTLAHSCQRYYSESSGDAQCDVVQVVEEGNISIHRDVDIKPFVLVHNGGVSVDECEIEVAVSSEDGRHKEFRSKPISWRPFETRFFILEDLVDFREFLGGQRGTYVIRLRLGGVFPRLISGHQRDGQWSIDHTNFAATSGPAVEDVVPVQNDDAYRELVFSVPNNSYEDWECFVDIYPTYPEDTGYWIDVDAVSSDGSFNRVSTIQLGRSWGELVPRINIENAALMSGKQMSLTYRHAENLPRRFHTGIHYQIKNGLPGFLTDGPMPTSTPGTRSRWFPVFDPSEHRNFLMLSNTQPDERTRQSVIFDCKLFNSVGDDPLLGEISLAPYEQKCEEVTKIFRQDPHDFLAGGPGWIYLAAREPQRAVVHYASVRGEESIAVCHAF